MGGPVGAPDLAASRAQPVSCLVQVPHAPPGGLMAMLCTIEGWRKLQRPSGTGLDSTAASCRRRRHAAAALPPPGSVPARTRHPG